MTTEEILKGKIDNEEKLSRKELEDLISSLHDVKLNDDNVDNIIKFLNYVKQYDYYIATSYFLYIIDHMNLEDLNIVRKIMLAHEDIAKNIQENIKKKKKSN